MRAINQPQISFTDIWQSCVGSISTVSLVDRLKVVSIQAITAAQDYAGKAPNADLFLIEQFVGKDEDIVFGAVTKSELKGLYSYHTVPAKKPARVYYDQLKLSAPFNICPFCGFGHVSTLDHYLPKAKFPFLSILPINLVPSCADCNKGKSASVATTKSQQSIHPYFDHGHFIYDQWLIANVLETIPVTISYSVKPPLNWNEVDKERVKAHFDDFGLARRFAVQAATELPTLKEELEYDFNIDRCEGVKKALVRKELAARKQHVNSWKTALYQALTKSEMYCSGGFKQA